MCSSLLISQGITRSILSEKALKALEFYVYGLIAAINAFATCECIIRPLSLLCTRSTDIYPTLALITAKLWRARERVSAISTDPDRWLLVGRVVLDSGAMYTVASLLVLCTLPMVNLSNCISDATTPVVVSLPVTLRIVTSIKHASGYRVQFAHHTARRHYARSHAKRGLRELAEFVPDWHRPSNQDIWSPRKRYPTLCFQDFSKPRYPRR